MNCYYNPGHTCERRLSYCQKGLVSLIQDALGHQTRYAYDGLNRLSSLTDSAGTTTYGYDEVGNRSSISYPNGSSQSWQYDTRNRLTRTAIYNSAGVLIQSFDYTLHPTGRRTAIAELDGRTSTYAYNDL